MNQYIKKMPHFALVALLSLGLVACGSQKTTNSQKGSFKLSEADAQTKAYKAAGIKESDVMTKSIEKSTEDGQSTYEVSFATKTDEYDIVIDGQSGKVLESDKEALSQVSSGSSQPDTSATNEAKISEMEAKEKALEIAGLKESDVRNLTVHLETEGMRKVYEIDFIETGHNQEHSFSIDSETGEVLEKNQEAAD